MNHSEAIAFLKRVSDNCKGVTITSIVLAKNNPLKNNYEVKIRAPNVLVLYEIIKFARNEGLCAAIDNGGIVIFDVPKEAVVECAQEVPQPIFTPSKTST